MKAIRIFIVILSVCFMTTLAVAAERMAVQSNVGNVRAEPGTKGDILWKMERYYPVLVIEKKGPWYRFKDVDGHTGWIHNSLLDRTPTVVVKVRLANIRSGPGTQNGIVFDAEKGTPFKVLQKKGAWIQVRHSDGDKGWVFKSLVW